MMTDKSVEDEFCLVIRPLDLYLDSKQFLYSQLEWN